MPVPVDYATPGDPVLGSTGVRPFPQAWSVLLVVGLVGVALYPLTERGGVVGNVLYLSLGAAGASSIVAGLIRHRPADLRPWLLMAAGLGLWVTGDVVYALDELVAGLPSSVTSVGAAFYLVAYPLFAAAMVGLSRHRSPRGDHAATIDALLVASGLGLLAWEVLVRPSLGDGGGLFSDVVTLGYPLGDVIVLAGLVRVVVTPGAWTTASRLLLGAVLLLVLADVASATATVYTGDYPRPLEMLWLASYVLWGSAALHPSMTELTGPAPTTPARFGPVRLAAVGAAVLVAPLMLAVQQAFSLKIDVWAVVIGAILLFGLVVTRMYLVIRQIARADRERSLLQERLAHDASHDFLTGLPNRAHGLVLVETALHRARRSGATVALLFVDLDGFKRVNDVHGHAAGDELLIQVGRRLHEQVRGGDVVARLGGDEFIVLLEPVDDVPAAMHAARRIVAALADPFALTSGPVRVGGSVGVAINSGLGTDVDGLLHHADLAAYRAKSHGKGRAELYDLALRQATAEQAALESAIRLGIDGDQLRTYYQPIVALRDREVIGYEALVRWERPGFGLVSPAEFVAVAEQSDLICDLDTWVLTRACTDFAGWQDGLFTRDVYVAVNLSARHLALSRVVDDVVGALAASGLPAARLVVEVTETTLGDELRSLEHLRQLRELGVTIAIDDFGTGYSSLSRLQEMPADIVKIDRSFLDAERSGWLQVVRLIVGAAQAVGLRTVAEGVESSEQLELLRRLGCDAAQGYHLARPMPAGSVPAFHHQLLSR